ncbi:73_t:CDS:1, partial [Funneliformis geosporum]
YDYEAILQLACYFGTKLKAYLISFHLDVVGKIIETDCPACPASDKGGFMDCGVIVALINGVFNTISITITATATYYVNNRQPNNNIPNNNINVLMYR